MSMAHKGGGYRSGCRCDDCVEKHRVQGINYYHRLQAELIELRKFRDDTMARGAATQQAGEKVPS